MALCAALAFALPVPSHAVTLDGSLGWEFKRSEHSNDFNTTVRYGLDQNYRVRAQGAVLSPRLAQWNTGIGWRQDITRGKGAADGDTNVRLADFDAGLLLLPVTMPVHLNYRRSSNDNKSEGSTSTETVTETYSVSTRFPMPDGNPLGFSAFQTDRDVDVDDSRSRIASLDKRFDLGDRHRLNTSYKYSQYQSAAVKSEGHAGSATVHSSWSPQLTSNAYANVSTQDTNVTRIAGGQSLFLSNSAGVGMSYRRGRAVTANARYGFSQSPQGTSGDIRTHQAVADTSIRANTKLDVDARVRARRLDLPATTLDTAGVTAGLRYRPWFGWNTGVRGGLSKNRTSGLASTSQSTYSMAVFLNARHELDPVQLNWGANTSYSSVTGNLSRDRLTSSANAGVHEKRLTWVRLDADYRFTDIRETNMGGSELKTFSQEHILSGSGRTPSRKNLWLRGDALSVSADVRSIWSRRFAEGRSVTGHTFRTDAQYTTRIGVAANTGYAFANSTADLGSSHKLYLNASWSRRVLRRGTSRLQGEVRKSYIGNDFDTLETSAQWSFDYNIGLLSIKFSADIQRTSFGPQDQISESNNMRLSIVRRF